MSDMLNMTFMILKLIFFVTKWHSSNKEICYVICYRLYINTDIFFLCLSLVLENRSLRFEK